MKKFLFIFMVLGLAPSMGYGMEQGFPNDKRNPKKTKIDEDEERKLIVPKEFLQIYEAIEQNDVRSFF